MSTKEKMRCWNYAYLLKKVYVQLIRVQMCIVLSSAFCWDIKKRNKSQIYPVTWCPFLIDKYFVKWGGVLSNNLCKEGANNPIIHHLTKAYMLKIIFPCIHSKWMITINCSWFGEVFDLMVVIICNLPLMIWKSIWFNGCNHLHFTNNVEST